MGLDAMILVFRMLRFKLTLNTHISSQLLCRSATAPWKLQLFIIEDWSAKVESQETPGVTGKFGLGLQNEAGQRLIECCQENTLVITLFQQHKRSLHMEITKWPTPKSDWLYSLQPKMEKLYTVSKNKTWSWLALRSWTPYCQIQI